MRHPAIIPTDDHQTPHPHRRVTAQINLRQGHWAFGLPAPVVCVIWAAGGPGQDCDVRPVAMPPGYSWTPTPSERTSANVGSGPVPPSPPAYPAGWWAGVTPAVGIRLWRSRRSTPSAGKLRAWGRAAA